jgi:hypothetical protein
VKYNYSLADTFKYIKSLLIMDLDAVKGGNYESQRSFNRMAERCPCNGEAGNRDNGKAARQAGELPGPEGR